MSEGPGVHPTKAEGEIPLEDIDRLLEAEDPEFAQQLEEVKKAEFDSNVEIEATAIDDSLSEEKDEDEPQAKRRKEPWLRRLKERIRFRLVAFAHSALVFLKTRPKEFLFYALALSKALIKNSLIPLKAFGAASRLQKLTVLGLLLLSVAAAAILVENFKGIWLPQLNSPILHSFADQANAVMTYDPSGATQSFEAAFPQERFEFLFPKIKVNLRATSDHPNPMGAFEVFIQVDSRDTVLELRARQVELFDLIQRVIEGETYPSLVTERGKARMKTDLETALNKQLTQGWVKDVSFKTFILKP